MVSKCFPRKGRLLTPQMTEKKTRAERGNVIRLRAHMCIGAQLGESAEAASPDQVLVLGELFPSTGAAFSTHCSVPGTAKWASSHRALFYSLLSHQLTYCFNRYTGFCTASVSFFTLIRHLLHMPKKRKESKRNAELNRQVCFLLLTAQEGILMYPHG